MHCLGSIMEITLGVFRDKVLELNGIFPSYPYLSIFACDA
jgi:hypothetical protein